MSKGGRGAGANVLMIKKAGNKRQELALREAFEVKHAVNKIEQERVFMITDIPDRDEAILPWKERLQTWSYYSCFNYCFLVVFSGESLSNFTNVGQ